jgi:hypothetical protein
MIAFWILLTLRLSAFHFAVAAPVAVGEILEVRSNAVGVLKDGITVWEKRMDSDNEDQWSTNEGHLPVKHADHSVSDDDRGNDSDYTSDSSDYEGLNGSDEGDLWDRLGLEPSRNLDEMRSNGRGPDPNHHRMSDTGDNEVDGGKGYLSDGNGSDENKSGYEADDDSERDHSMQSSQGSVEPGPQSEHPATLKKLPLTFLEDLFEGSPKLRPRNSYLPLRTTQVTSILTLSSMVRARAASASSVHDLPGRRQN